MRIRPESFKRRVRPGWGFEGGDLDVSISHYDARKTRVKRGEGGADRRELTFVKSGGRAVVLAE